MSVGMAQQNEPVADTLGICKLLDGEQQGGNFLIPVPER